VPKSNFEFEVGIGEWDVIIYLKIPPCKNTFLKTDPYSVTNSSLVFSK
jgi:hypothetical protein